MSLLLALTGGVAPTSYALTCDAGAYTYTGQAATLKLARRLTCAVGAYVYTGQSATLTLARKLSLAVGAYTYTGQAATLKVGRRLSLATGAYTYSGQAATLTVARRLTGAAGAYSYAGQAATLTVGRRLSLAAGAYTYTGQSATLTVGRRQTLSAGSYTYTGQAATLTVARGMELATGAYAYAGQAATLTYLPGSVVVEVKTTSGGADGKDRSHNIFKPSGEPLKRKKRKQNAETKEQRTVEPVAKVIVPKKQPEVRTVKVETIPEIVIIEPLTTLLDQQAERNRQEEEILLNLFVNDSVEYAGEREIDLSIIFDSVIDSVDKQQKALRYVTELLTIGSDIANQKIELERKQAEAGLHFDALNETLKTKQNQEQFMMQAIHGVLQQTQEQTAALSSLASEIRSLAASVVTKDVKKKLKVIRKDGVMVGGEVSYQ